MTNITIDDDFFPPPWDIYENPEKTEGGIEFQRYMKKDPEYYSYQPERLSEKTYYRNQDRTYPHLESCIGSDSLNSMET